MPKKTGRNQLDPNEVIKRIDQLEEVLPQEVERFTSGQGKRKTVLERLRGLIDRLTTLYRALDPIEHSDIYDPSHPDTAADLIADRLNQSPLLPLNNLPRFWGSGVYALYYTGEHPAYARISNTEIPIYVGKADPGKPMATTAMEQGTKLYARLVNDHARSIRAAEEYFSQLAEGDRERTELAAIRLEDFQCRYLVLASAYAGAVERNLIHHHKPVWNNEIRICIGFGKHGDKATTRKNTRSDWDTIHPGRTWATSEDNVANPRTPLVIQDDILEHCRRVYGEDE